MGLKVREVCPRLKGSQSPEVGACLGKGGAQDSSHLGWAHLSPCAQLRALSSYEQEGPLMTLVACGT